MLNRPLSVSDSHFPWSPFNSDGVIKWDHMYVWHRVKLFFFKLLRLCQIAGGNHMSDNILCLSVFIHDGYSPWGILTPVALCPINSFLSLELSSRIIFSAKLSLTPAAFQNSYTCKSLGHLVWNADSLVLATETQSWAHGESTLGDFLVCGPLTYFNTLCTTHGKSWIGMDALLDRHIIQEDVFSHMESVVVSHRVPKCPYVLSLQPTFCKLDHVAYTW